MTFTRFLKVLKLQPLETLGTLVLIGFAGHLLSEQYHTRVAKPWEQQRLAEVSRQADQTAGAVSQHVQTTRDLLSKLAAIDSVIDAVVSGEQAQLDAVQDVIVNQDSTLERAQLVTSASDYAAKNSNFVAIDLVNSAIIHGEPVGPAAANIGGDWQIYMAAPVVLADRTVGSLLVSLNRESLRQTLGAAGVATGLITLRQTTVGFSPQTIAAFNPNNISVVSRRAVSSVSGATGWEVMVEASPGIEARTPVNLGNFALVATVIIGGTGVLIAFLCLYAIHRSGESAISAAKDNAPTMDDPNPDQLRKNIAEKLAQHTDNLATKEKQPAHYPVGSKPAEPAESPEIDANQSQNSSTIPVSVFRDYDIRGNAETDITPDFAETLGKSLGARASLQNITWLAVACDGRLTSPDLKQALARGILSTGCNVADFGAVPTPVFNFGLRLFPDINSGVVVTASHNPALDNGFKIVVENEVLAPEDIKGLAAEMAAGNWPSGEGCLEQREVIDAYCKAMVDDVDITRSVTVAVDCANGIMGPIAPRVLEALGCQVIPLYCDVNGDFPYHEPDPSDPGNLQDLIHHIKNANADIGFGFDGDGDRVVAVTADGEIVWPDELMMIFARDLLTRDPDTSIVFDVKSTRRLGELISGYGGTPVMTKTGHSNMRRKIKQTGAPLGGEYSGHIFFGDRWPGFDDGLYASARLLEILDKREQTLTQVMAGFAPSVTTPELKMPVPEDKKFNLIALVQKNTVFKHASLIKLDGLRVEFAEGWGLVRASNTSAALTFRFEAQSEEALKKIQGVFREQLSNFVSLDELPF